jgi:hypothetical protein
VGPELDVEELLYPSSLLDISVEHEEFFTDLVQKLSEVLNPLKPQAACPSTTAIMYTII